MSYGRFKTRDANRWGKKYPTVRVRKVPVLVGDKETWIESSEVEFDGADTHTYNFEQKFPSAPTVTATPLDSEGTTAVSVNIYIVSVDRFSVTFGASQEFTGQVMIQAIYIEG